MTGSIRHLVGAIALSASLLHAQEVGVTARIDSTHFRVGDIIIVNLTARVPGNLRSIVPTAKDSLGPFEIVKFERLGADPAWALQVMTLDSGNMFIPPIEFAYSTTSDTNRRSSFSNPLTIKVSGITVDPQGEIRDIKPPMYAPWLFEDYLPYLLGALVLIAAGGAYYYYRQQKLKKLAQLVPARPKIPAHKEALAALRLIEDKKLWQQGRVKEYYTEVTEIIRVFFERRWGIVALEMTTDEILGQMKQFSESERLRNEMTSLFSLADLVKFAKYQPTPTDHDNELKWAYEIVRGMIPAAKTVEEEQQQTKEQADVR